MMIFRNGKAINGSGTAFSLCEMDSIDEFFFLDDNVFDDDVIDYFVPEDVIILKHSLPFLLQNMYQHYLL